MNLKEKFNTRLARVKEYTVAVSRCRDLKQKLNLAEKDITKIVDADKVEDTSVCIKNYFTTLPANDVFETGENVYWHSTRCHRFFEKPCPVSNCPYHAQNIRYRNYQSLLSQAQSAKQAAYKVIFERIK